jgi:hypothetical protein
MNTNKYTLDIKVLKRIIKYIKQAKINEIIINDVASDVQSD